MNQSDPTSEGVPGSDGNPACGLLMGSLADIIAFTFNLSVKTIKALS